MISKSAMTPSRSGRTAWMLPGRAAEHLLGLAADGEDLVAAARVALDGDDGGLAGDDALALHVDEGVRRPEIDREIVREQAVEPVEDHRVVLRVGRRAVRVAQARGTRSQRGSRV